MAAPPLFVGLGGATSNACVAIGTPDRILGVCEQERITRVRAAGFNATGLPDEVLDELLRRAGRGRADVKAYGVAEAIPRIEGIEPIRFDHHQAHAASAYLPSPFESAAVVVCDHEPPQISVWQGSAGAVTRIDLPWQGMGFAELYTRCAGILRFGSRGREQRMEALARLDPGRRDQRAEELFGLEGDRLRLAPGWEGQLESWGQGSDSSVRAATAAAVQSRLSDLLIEFLASVRRMLPHHTDLCVGGSLFFNSHFNSRVRLDGGFDRVFIPVNPGNAGLAVANVLQASGQPRGPVSPFLGPSYSSEEVKATLDNCKLTYQWASERETIALAVDALKRGRLVAWFDGPMEWGARALGSRSILANPFAPFALDNLNQFLKQREVWRGYALSGLHSAVREHFDGPEASPFMECDFVPKSPETLRHILPGPKASVRVHTVEVETAPRFHALLSAFQEASGIPMLVNTSFNGFREPMVCSPRDAVRVFYGTGVDILIFDQFAMSK